VEYARQLLEEIGLDPQRLQMINLSAAMAGEFTFSAAEINATIERLGPSPLRPHKSQEKGETRKEEVQKEGATEVSDVNDT
jgi:F420-non-reducing hydrogenase iron-sulfur subunit